MYQVALSSESNNSDENLRKFKQMIMSRQRGDHRQSLRVANSLKGDIEDEKFFLILKTIIASKVDDESYSNALKQLIQKHGNDPTIYLQKIDYYSFLEDYDEVIKNIKLLIEETGDDFPYFLIASYELEQNNYEAAEKHFKYIIDNYDSFFEAQVSYLFCLTLDTDSERAMEYLETLVLEYDKDSLVLYLEESEEDGSNIFEEFVNSDAFLKWKE